MKYDIILSKDNSIISRIIKYLTKSEYSHVSIMVDACYIAESIGFESVQIKRFYETDYDVFRVVGLTDEQKEKIGEFIIQNLNHKYDYFRLISMAFHIIFKWNVVNISKWYTCDEFVLLSFLNANIDLLPDKDIDEITPNDFASSDMLTRVL